MNQQQVGGQGPNTWVGNDANTLLVVATLITTLTYQLGTNIPGGYWQETKSVDGRELYRAGDPIMRDLQNARYVHACGPFDRSIVWWGVGITIFMVALVDTGCSWWRAGRG